MKYNVTLNGKIYEVDVTESDAVVTGISQVPVNTVVAPAPVAAPEAPAAAPAAAPVAANGTQVKAPMPGTILAVKKNVGDAVKAGDVIVVLEAMKMENDIVAPCDGTVKSINAPKGSTVNTDDVLAVI
ncbi:MAG: biotin/lipoyl-binding protein [Clostridia bacterium]|nr:biotin/lipoyl-binding protein [Clostridia bacterium]